MYGTTMIGKLARSTSADDIRREVSDWETQRNVPGYQGSHVMLADDGKTVINVAIFDNKEHYLALADDPVQDEWWRTRMAPMLDGDPQWVDGEWLS